MPQFKEKAKRIMDKENEKINLLTEHIKKMNEIIKNEYIPIPEYIIVYEECQKEKINEEIPQNQLFITIKNISYEESNLKIILSIMNKKQEIQCKKGKEIDETFKWEFFPDNFIDLFNNNLNLSLMLNNLLKGQAKIPLKNLKKNNKVEQTVKIQMENEEEEENNNTFIDVSIKIRKALIEPEYENKEEEFLRIKKYYPKFEKSQYFYLKNTQKIIKEDIGQKINKEKESIEAINNQKNKENIDKVNNNDNRNIKNNQMIKEIIDSLNKDNKNIAENNNNKEKEINIKKEKEIKNNNEKTNENNNENNKFINHKKIDINASNQNSKQVKEEINKSKENEKINKNIFKEEELKDVDYIDNLNSIKVLEDRLKEMEKIIRKIDGRTPKEILQRKINISFKLNQMKKQMNEGEIDPKQYLLILESQKNHDLLLYKFLKQENRIDDTKKVISRIKMLNEEIKELKAFCQQK